MDRIIKFRAIDLFSDFVYGQSFYIDKENNTGYIANGIDDYHPVKSETVGQFTGLVDKNGVEIYEGDFVIHRYSKEEGKNDYIIFDTSTLSFMLNDMSYQDWATSEWYDIDNLEVIGNIYENPELLK